MTGLTLVVKMPDSVLVNKHSIRVIHEPLPAQLVTGTVQGREADVR